MKRQLEKVTFIHVLSLMFAHQGTHLSLFQIFSAGVHAREVDHFHLVKNVKEHLAIFFLKGTITITPFLELRISNGLLGMLMFTRKTLSSSHKIS